MLKVKENQHFDGSRTKSVLFAVQNTWKGINETQVIITTGLGGGDCGYEFEEGKEYLVYAFESRMYSEEEKLVTIICDRTTLLNSAEEDLSILGEGKSPTKTVNLEDELHKSRINPYLWFIPILLVGFLAFWVWRRVKQ